MNCIRRTCHVLLFALVINRGHVRAELAQPSLSQRIDRAIAAAHFGELAQASTDEEFLRRVYLDLVGRSPSRNETRTFLANGDANKRAATVNRLLASAEFNQHFASVLDVILMERRDGTRIPQAEWLSFLQKAVADEWSYDNIVKAILTADGTGEARGAAKFLVQREVEANALTRDVGRIFLGRDLQCAQCHDHPNIVDYEQSEYFGILSFVDRSYLFEDGADNKKSYVGEKAEGEAEYKSVFLPDDDPSQSRPHLLSGLALDVEPRFDGDNAYVVAPTKKAAGLPKFSRRAQLARLITHPANEHFAKNSVNRFWKHMMGRGLVDPVDFHHSDNPPSHPALLKVLADEFVSTGFDIRGLLRQIANSDTYQRSVDFPRGKLPALAEIEQRIAQLDVSIEELSADDQESDAETECRGRLALYRQRVARLDAAIDAASKQWTESDQDRAEKTKAVANLQQKLATKKTQLVALKEAIIAAKKVAEAIAKEPSLSDATAEYRRRADQISKEIELARNQLVERKKLTESIAAEVQQLMRTLAKLRSERIGLVDMVAEARGALGVVQARQQRRLASLNEQQQHRAALLIQRQLARKLRSKSEAKQQLAILEEAKASIDATEREALTQAIGTADQRIAERRGEVAALTRAMAEMNNGLADTRRRAESLELAISESKSANLKLNDPQVTAAVATMAKSLQLLGERVAAGRLAVADHAQRLAAATSVVEQQCVARDQLIERQKGYAEQRAEIELEMKAARERLDLVNAEAELADTRLRRSLEQRFVVRSIVPLSPEQLAGSTIAALELKARFQREAESEWDKLHKGQNPQEVDLDKKAAEIGKLVQKRVDSVVRTYVSMFAAPGGSPQDVFSATADQALFLSNDGRVQGWLSPSEESLISRLAAINDPATLAEELHLAILSRSASKEEVEEVTVYLQRRADDRKKAIRELAWGLLTSLEFRFNH